MTQCCGLERTKGNAMTLVTTQIADAERSFDRRDTSPPRQVQVCEIDEIAIGLGRAFDVGGRPIAVFRGRTGDIYAVDGLCPHKAGPLADGMLVGNQVVCPLHAYRFDGTNGDCDQAGACGINAYPVEVRTAAVYVTVPGS